MSILNNPLKPALSIQDQITLLIQRGMLIADINQASNFLQNNYYLAMTSGPDCIYNSDMCENIQNHVTFLTHLYETINSRQKDPVIKHHLSNYGGHFPIWTIVEYLSMNETSKYFSSLKPADRKAIALQGFNLDENILKSWLEAFGVLRNICAHFGYLHERKLTKKPEMSKSMKAFGVPNDTLFSLCLVTKELTDKQHWQDFVSSIAVKVDTTPSFVLAEYGFPINGLDYLYP